MASVGRMAAIGLLLLSALLPAPPAWGQGTSSRDPARLYQMGVVGGAGIEPATSAL
jgi:hypothetical protein